MASMPSTSSDGPQPAWEIATLWPDQGQWSDFDYLALTSSTTRLIELVDGRVEVLPRPTLKHQLILQWLYRELHSFVAKGDLGLVVLAALRVRLGAKHFREPDLIFMRAENRDRAGNDYFQGADLVMEVVSPDAESKKRDYQEKFKAYAEAGIPEYWIVDPQEEKVTVYTLPEAASEYAEHGVFADGEMATSVLLPGFEVDVKSVFDAGKQ